MSIIKATSLSKVYRTRGNKNLLTGLLRPEWKEKRAVDGVSFEIAEGEAVAFLGPNGAGKTTTTKMMTGLISPTSGAISVMGFDPFDRDESYLKQIGLVMGNKAGLNWDLTARQSYWLNQQIYEMSQKKYEERVRYLTQLLDVEDFLDVQVRRLSLGERMKMELIGAILHEPKVLFLDEPTIGLDIIAKNKIREFLRTIHAQGQTLVLTSHDMDDIQEVCERVIVINDGTKVYDDSLKNLVDAHRDDRYIRLVFAGKRPSKAALSEYGTILGANDAEVLLRVSTIKMVQAISQISGTYQVLDLRVESAPLEEIIGELYVASRK